MKMKRILILSLFLLGYGTFLMSQTGLKAFMPKGDELPGWLVSGEVKEYRGEELIFAANREADLYHEFGFKGVLTGRFKDQDSDQITLEIFRMKDVYASYAIYLHKSEGMVEKYDVGNEAFINDNALVLWKHHFVAVIKGDATDLNVSVGMKQLADIVDSRIRIPGRWPKIAHTFRDSPGSITLLRGKLGLQNVYFFTSKDVFRVEEGYAIQKPGLTDIHLIYSDSFTSIQRFGEVAGLLSREGRFSGFNMIGSTAFRMRDNEGNDISIESDNNLLNIRIQKNIVTASQESN